jgi:hypothetical protein
VRRYKKWAAQWSSDWQSIGTMQMQNQANGPASAKTSAPKKSGRILLLFAGLAFIAIPLTLPPNGDGRTTLGLCWLASSGYLGVSTLRAVMKRGGARRNAERSRPGRAGRDEVAPVSWLLSRASGGPSRTEATRQLPAYCMKLLDRQ